MLTLIIAECGLELIPREIRKHSAVIRNFSSKNFSSQLLDNALHHAAMQNLESYEKRGRPDITHLCILNALGSPLNKSGNLNFFIHTINNKIFKFNPKIRVARNYNRFKGLMAKLLIEGIIETESAQLITPVETKLKDLVNSFDVPQIYIFSRKGKLLQDFNSLFSRDLSKNNVAIIGGFQKSSFAKKILKLSDNLISISEYPLDAWVAVNKILCYYEIIQNIR